MQPFGIFPGVRQPQAPNYGQPSAPRSDTSAPFAPSFPESSPDTSPRGQFAPNQTPFPTQAPSVSPQMLDQYNRVGEDANARNIARQNFLNSVKVNNDRQRLGQQAQSDTLAAGGGFVDAARANTSAANAAQSSIQSPSAPSIIVGGGRSTPFAISPGSNITSLGGTNASAAPGAKAPPLIPAPKGYIIRDQGEYKDNPSAKDKDGNLITGQQAREYYPGATHLTFGPQATPSTPAPTTQPAAAPSPQYRDATAPGYQSPQGYVPGGANNPKPGQIQWTHQQAQESWKNHLANAGGDLGAAGDAFHDTMGKYGIDGYKLLTHYADSGIDLNNAQRQVAPVTGTAPRIPVSMLGPDNGMERFPNSGGNPGIGPFLPSPARQSVPGPTVSPAATVTPGGTAPFRGSTPIGPEFNIGSTAPDTNTGMRQLPYSMPASMAFNGRPPGPGVAAPANQPSPTSQPASRNILDEATDLASQRRGAVTRPAAQAKSKSVSPDLAKQFLAQSGGDKDKARAMAKQQGYQF